MTAYLPLCLPLPRESDLPPRSGIKVEFRGLLLDRSGGRQAKVLYDFTAANEDELTVIAGWVSTQALGAKVAGPYSITASPSCRPIIVAGRK